MKKGLFHRIFGRLLRREIFHDWAQSLAIVSIGAIAVTLFVGLQANSGAMEERLNEMVSLSNPADIYVTTDPHSLKSADDSDMILSHLDEGDYLESRFLGYCNMESHNIALTCAYSLPHISKGYDIEVTTDSSDTDFFLVDHSYAMDVALNKVDEPLLGKNMEISFDVTGFHLGESTLSMLDSFVKEGKENPFRKGSLIMHSTVTGIMKHPENTTKANPIPMLTYMSNRRFHDILVDALEEHFTDLGVRLIYRQGFYEKLGWGDGEVNGTVVNFPMGNQYLVKLKDASTAAKKKDAIVHAYEAKATNNLYSAQLLEDMMFMSTLRMEIDQAKKLSMVFPVVFFVVAVLVIITTIRQNILKRRMEIGTFKALGMRKSEIHGQFLMQTGFLVLLSSLIGAIAGPLIIPGIMAHKYDILYTLPNSQYFFPLLTGIGSIVAFLIVSLGATFLITRREIALKPVESMRPKTMKMHRKLSFNSAKKRSALSLSVKMAGRNIIYDPVKSFMVILGLAGCTALLVCGFGIDNTLDYDIATDPYVNSYRDDMATFLPAQKESQIRLDFSEVKTEEGTPMIASYQPYDRFSLEILSGDRSFTSYLFILGESVSLDGSPCPAHMDEDFPKDEVLLSQKAADQLRAHVGDKVKFYVSSTYVEAKVSRIYDAFYANSIIMHYDSPLLPSSYEDYPYAWVEAREGVSQLALKEALLNIEAVRLVDTSSEWKARVESIVSSISTMTAAVKVFAILLAIVVIYNLGLLNFRERTREIATMKVVGFHTAEIAASLLIEALSMTLLGIAAGLAVGYPFMKLVLMINQVDVIHYIYHIEPLTYVLAAIGSFLTAVAVNIVLSYRIKKVHAVESLKSVE